MEDFASAAMMRLVKAGLARQRLGPDDVTSSASAAFRGAHLPIDKKRSILAHVFAVAGPLAILKIGEAADEMPEEPVHIALRAARNPHDLIERWQRLERFVHSRHRIVIDQFEDNRLALRHVSERADQPPRPEEDLLVFGVIVALIRTIGAMGLRAKMRSSKAWQFDGGWRTTILSEDAAAWEILWSGMAPNPYRTQPDQAPGEALRHLLCSDLVRRWTIDDAARELGLSSRSLQRALQEQGVTYSDVLASARATAAAHYLQSGCMSLSEIGYICGYADQAHFTRLFKVASAMTPGSYQRNFPAASGD